MRLDERCERLVQWIRDQVNGSGARGTVVGLSGGVDSAVTAALCKRAFPQEVLGLIMPCHSDPKDAADAELVAASLHIPVKRVELSDIYDLYLERLGKETGSVANPLASANIKPRLRMMTLYYFANSLNYLVVGTGNKSELSVGYFTKYGDGGVDILPLGNLVKKEVRELAVFLGLPRGIIEKPPSAGLWPGQTDEGEMGISYDQLDRYILTGEAEPGIAAIIERLATASRHKRELPPVPPF